MRVFITGATGFVGVRLVPELISAGHGVIGLARSERSAQTLAAAGCEVIRGSTEDGKALHAGAAGSDAVVHLAFENDFEHLAAACEKDRIAIETLAEALADTGRPFIVTSFTGLGNTVPGKLALESNAADPHDSNPRTASEFGAAAAVDAGASVAVMRLPMVHDPLKQGVITAFVALARKKGVSAYVEDGANRFPSSAVMDVARLYRLALERHEAGAVYHAVDEEGVPLREIAEMIGRGLDVPVRSVPKAEAEAHFEFLTEFATRDLPASSAETRRRLGWEPTGPALLADMGQLRF